MSIHTDVISEEYFRNIFVPFKYYQNNQIHHQNNLLQFHDDICKKEAQLTQLITKHTLQIGIDMASPRGSTSRFSHATFYGNTMIYNDLLTTRLINNPDEYVSLEHNSQMHLHLPFDKPKTFKENTTAFFRGRQAGRKKGGNRKYKR